MILGLDLGNYSVKTSEEKSFLSSVRRDNGFSTSDSIIINDEKFILGQGEHDNEYRKCNKKNLSTLIYSAISTSSNDTHNKIVVGLPISQFQADRQILKERILNDDRAVVDFNGKCKEVIIDDVEVYCEGLGAVNNEFDGVVVDLGGRTTDIFRVNTCNKKRIIENAFSEPVGTLNLYSDFIKLVNAKYSLNLKGNEAERILKRGLKLNGISADIRSCLNIFKDYVEMIENKLKAEYPISTLDLKLLGGGALLLGSNLKNKFAHAQIDTDIFVNAKVFKKVGEKKWHAGL